MAHHYENLDKYKPFLVNVIKKLQSSEQTSKNMNDCKYVQSLLLILEKRKLDIENVERCESILQKMVEKVEKNTIEAFKAKASGGKTNQSLNESGKEFVFDHSKDIISTALILHLDKYDPRIQKGNIKNRQKVRGLYLLKIKSYKSVPAVAKSDRLAYKYKTMIKSKQTPEPPQTSLLNVPSVPQMVPPPNSAITNMISNFALTNSQGLSYHDNQYLSLSGTNANSASQVPAKISQNDPRLRNRSMSQSSSNQMQNSNIFDVSNDTQNYNRNSIESEKPLFERRPPKTETNLTEQTSLPSMVSKLAENQSMQRPFQNMIYTDQKHDKYNVTNSNKSTAGPSSSKTKTTTTTQNQEKISEESCSKSNKLSEPSQEEKPAKFKIVPDASILEILESTYGKEIGAKVKSLISKTSTTKSNKKESKQKASKDTRSPVKAKSSLKKVSKTLSKKTEKMLIKTQDSIKTEEKTEIENTTSINESIADVDQSHNGSLDKSADTSPKKNLKRKKGKSELDKLNEDINEMFIRDGVLNATGRRNVRQTVTYNEDKLLNKKIKLASPQKPKVPEKKLMTECKRACGPLSKIYNLKPCSVLLRPLLSLITNPRNTNPDIHLQSQYEKQCVLCDFYSNRSSLTSHYINMHPTKEIFTSRLNAKVARSIYLNPHMKEGILESARFSPSAKITMKCKFCVEKLSLTGKNWKLHFMQHTGEFKCKGCNVRHGEPLASKIFINKYPHAKDCRINCFTTEDVQIDKGTLSAFMCDLCHFVQLKKENLIKHLNMEHDIHGDETPIIHFEILNYQLDVSASRNEVDIKPDLSNLSAHTESVHHLDHTYSSPTSTVTTKDQNEAKQNKELVSKSILPTTNQNLLKVWVNRPTTKKQQFVLEMLTNDDVLFSFYKCMVDDCCFATSDENLAKLHFNNHKISNYECCYCDSSFKNGNDLLEHMQSLHDNCAWQCAYCFYRSCAAFNVVTHQSHYHSSRQTKILSCNGHQAHAANDLSIINLSKEKYVPPLVCSS